MKQLLEALNIFNKYIPDNRTPFHCEHDVLFVDCKPELVSQEDKDQLDILGFIEGDEDSEYEGGFFSYRFGSC